MPNNIPRPEEVLGKSNKIPPPSEVLGKPIKKKESTSKDSHFYTEAVKEAGLPVTGQKKEQKPSVSSTTKDKKPSDIYTGYPGKEWKKYRLDNSTGKPVWMEYSDTSFKGDKQIENYNKPITDPARVAALNKHFNIKASASKDEEVFVGLPGRELNEYRVRDGEWQRRLPKSTSWEPLHKKETVETLNNYFNKNVEYNAAKAKFSGVTEDIDKVKQDQLNSNLKLINSKVIGKSEEDVVPLLKNSFPDFKFIESGAMVDEMKVIAPNGKTMMISLDNFTHGDDLQQSLLLQEFIRSNSNKEMVDAKDKLVKAETTLNEFNPQPVDIKIRLGEGEGDVQNLLGIQGSYGSTEQPETDILTASQNAKTARSEYFKKSKENFVDTKDRMKYAMRTGTTIDDKAARAAYANLEMDKSVVDASNSYMNDLSAAGKDLEKQYADLNNYSESIKAKYESGEITLDELNSKYIPQIKEIANGLEEKRKNIQSSVGDVYTFNDQIREAAASNLIIKESTGSFGGGLAYNFSKGLTDVLRLGAGLMGADSENTKRAQEQFIRDVIGSGTTAEYMSSEDRSDLTKVLFSLSQTAGNIIGSGGLGGAAGKIGASKLGVSAAEFAPFYATSYYELKDQFDAPEFAGVSDGEKVLMSTLYGFAVGALEKFGVSKSLSKSPIGQNFTNMIIKNTFKDLPKDAGKEMIELAIENNIKKKLAATGVNTLGAMFTEFSTEATQEGFGIGLKEAYDAVKGNDYFNSGTAWDITSQILEAGYLGALGGGIMHTAPASVDLIKNAKSINNIDQLRLMEMTLADADMRSAIFTDIKSKVATGELSKDEGKEQIASIKKASGIFSKLPDNLSDEQKMTSVSLLTERTILEEKIQGKDEALVSAQKERINAINEELKTISQNATKENNVEQQEGTTEGSTVQYQGADEGQQKVGQGEGTVGQTAQPEADTSNSTVTSEESKVVSTELEAKENDLGEKLKTKYSELESQGMNLEEMRDNPEYKAIRDEWYKAHLELSNSKTKEVTPAFKETEDVNLYSQSLEAARAEMKKAGKGDDLQVSPVSPEEAQAIVDEGGKIFISEDGKYGGYVKADGYMGGLFKDPNMKYKGVSKLLQDARVKEGGRFMEGFATYLEKEYVKNGFRPVARLKFNEEYAPEGWDAPNSSLRTKPDVVFFAYDPTGKYEVGEGEYFDDYDQAYETAKNYGIDTKAANAESIEQMLQSEEYADVDTKLLKAARLVSKALPKTKIYLHKTTDAYNAGIARAAGMTKEQVANEEGQSSGEYVNGEIHINLEIADATTVFHEAFHDIFMKKAFTSGAAIDMANGLRKIVSDKALIKRLDDFISNYESAEQSEEFLAELTGIITDAEVELTTTKLHAFKQLINKIAQKLGLPAIFGASASRQEVLDFINTMSRKLRTGEKIEDGITVSTRKKRISPENSSNYANLTEDGKGNFVFYHVGGNGFETIKRGSGGTLATSKAEANAIGKVGGIAQYYTRPEDGESMVSGPSKYIVKVDQGKVYDFNTDPDNLFEKAKERFESEYPGIAFDANTQLAYVTKIANEQGYDMVVADWNGRTRAQTTNEFTPDDVQISEGNTIVKPFKENYISNTAKGYESVIPESKISKLEKLFDKIYKVRNAESKYDALYSIGQNYGKMSTEEISLLILNSDLSEDIKNEYNDIMSYEPGVRSSRKKRKAPTVEQQIAKAVRDSKMDFKNKQRAIASLVRDMQKSGKINAKQAAIIVERFSKLNVDNPVTVDRYLKYVEKVMNDADYDQKLKNARSLRSKIKRFKNAQATVVAMGKKFTSIDPSMIDDLESYMEFGEKVYNALKPTRTNGMNASFRMAAVIGEINAYSDKVLSDIEESVKNDLLNTYKALVDAGVINAKMTLKELQAEIKKMDENPEHVTDYEADIREINKYMFESLSKTIEMDQFTPEEQKLIKEFMAMDLEKMSVRDGYAAVEAMDNLRLNGILDGVQAMVYQYKGYTNAAELKSKVKTRDLRLYFSKGIGRFVSNQSANLKVLADTIFIGVKSGGEVLTKMGVSAFETGIARASKIFRSEVDSYGNDFHKTRPNGESFHTARNAFERGFYATLKRTVIGSESEQKAEFKRKVGLIKESIKTLSEGSKDEKKKSALYQEIYEKLGLDKAESILDVETKVDKINRDAVDHVINMWSKYYQQLSDVSLSVYNTMLKADLNYTTDKFARLTRNVISKKDAERMISKNGSFASAVGFTDKSKSGVLIESTKPNLTPGRYIDLNFDMNNFTALKAALIDINTAGPVRQIEAFLKSKDYQSMISSAEDLALFTKRVNNYITRAKGKEMIDNDSWRDAERMLNVLATFGTSKALGSVMQPIKQVVPVALNTMINAKTADLNIIESMNTEFNEWYKNNGISTSNRGAESTSAIESADKYLDSIPDSKLGKVAEHASRLNEFWIKKFLANPDVFIARASWLTYYKQSLKEQGIDTKDIDWSTHEKNEKAADYAVHQVDRQQGVSDTAMAGELFASKNSLSKIVKNTIFPFATFSMNQKQRMYSDIRTLADKNATSEDKKIALRSASALTIEMLAYQAIGWSIRYFIYKSIAEAITGVEPDDEDEERDWKFALQYTISNTVKDFFSIAPPLDGVTLKGFDAIMSGLQNLADYGGMEANEAVKAENLKREENGEEKMTPEEEKKFRDELFNDNRWRFEDFDNGMLNAGTYTILYQKAVENYNLEEMARTGKVIEENDYGTKEKFLLPEDVSKLRTMLALDGAFILGFLPADSHSISKNVQKIIKRRALTEVQMEKYKEIKKEYGNVPDYVLGIIKDTRKEVPKIIEEMEWIKREGGLTKDQEKKYMSIMKKNGEVTSDDLRKIKSGS